MSRTVIRIEEISLGQQKLRVLHLEDWPAHFQPPSAMPQLNKSPIAILHTAAPFSTFRGNNQGTNLVEDVGRDLCRQLDQNADIQAALHHVNGAKGKSALFFQIFSPDDDPFPWETVWKAPNHFLGYQVRSPIGRMVTGASHLPVRDLPQDTVTQPPTLRILAVLTAQHKAPYFISSETQWDHLYDAKIQIEKRNNLAVELDVLVDDPTLENKIQQQLPAPAAVHRGHVRLLTGKADLLDRLGLFRPHLLHFFCHGSNNNGSPHLLLGMNSGQMCAITESDIIDKLEDIQHDAWLAVLNCCSSAQGSAASQAFAQLLIGPRLPVVIGMAEPIDTTTADAFTQTFYPEAFDLIDKAVVQNKAGAAGPFPIEWAEIMHKPRKTILEVHNAHFVQYAHQRDQKCWTLPILFATPGVFRFQVTTRSTAAQVAASVASTIAGAVRTLPALPGDLSEQIAPLTNSP